MLFRIIAGVCLLLFCHGVSSADDVAIYGTQPVTLKPNILIIFDNSGSMGTKDVVKAVYDPSTTYSGSKDANAVYYRKVVCSWWSCWYEWQKRVDHTSDLKCTWIKNDLLAKGYARGHLRNDQTCGGTRYNLRTGNYMNFEATTGGLYQTRLDAAKSVVKELLNEVADVRFGLMFFNTSEGGYVKDECGTPNSVISDHVDAISATTWTPLAETLAEAGLYFAGEASHFNSGTYTSPIENRCQKNYVIIITDGEPTKDRNTLLYGKTYYNSKRIGDYNKDGKELRSDGSVIAGDSDSTDFLDDVAGFLFNEDMHPMGAGTSFEKQSIITHTIGFKITHDLLRRTAREGGGSYHTADTATSLKEAFTHIISTIVEESSVFVAPVVPVNRLNRTSDGGFIYLAFFKPLQVGEWVGNLKKYALSETGEILDANGRTAVTSDGVIKGNSQSYWATASDGNDVATGGAGARIAAQTLRNFYTYTGTKADLTDATNAFVSTNTAIGVSAAQIEAVRNGVGDSQWPVGAIIHSEPSVVHYSKTESAIFFGSNDGLFRCIDDANGEELWAFVPPGQFGRLGLLSDNNNDYYVDASPAISFGEKIADTHLFAPKMLMFGERRGGSSYYALDISDRTKPKWMYAIGSDHLTAGGALGETLGESWGTPLYRTIKGPGGFDVDAFLLPGGYDHQQDLEVPSSTDGVGRAIFSVKASDGTVGPVNVNAKNFDKMTHSIVSIHAVDPDATGITTRIYAADMAGQVFVLADDISIVSTSDGREAKEVAPSGVWDYKNRLFKADQGKAFYSPVPADVDGIETLFFGTGNREDPLNKTEVNRFFSVRNTWLDDDLTDSHLVNVSDPNGDYEQLLKNMKGWYIEFAAGEKVVSQAKVDAGIVYFTTYTPDSGSGVNANDPCAGTGARGQGRLYAVRAKDGKPITDWEEPDKIKRRSTNLPPDLPIAVPIIKNRKIHVGPRSWSLPENDRVDYFYWRQR